MIYFEDWMESLGLMVLMELGLRLSSPLDSLELVLLALLDPPDFLDTKERKDPEEKR